MTRKFVKLKHPGGWNYIPTHFTNTPPGVGIKFLPWVPITKNRKNIGFLTNRAGRNKIPYHLGNYSFPCGFAARERIIFRVVRNFIPSRAIGQESYNILNILKD